MIKYAGVPQLGDYVMILDDISKVYRVDKIEMAIDEPIWCYLSGGSRKWSSDELTRVKPTWNIGELVRYKGRVYKVQNVTVRNYRFVYTLDDKDWVAEKDLEAANNIRHMFRPDDWISVNKYCTEEQFRGMKGRINVISRLGVSCFLRGMGPQAYDIPWEAIDVEEKKVELYNAELICVESNDGAWEVGDLAIVRDNEMYFMYKDTGKKLLVAENVDCLDAVNKFFPRVTFAEIKETIGDKACWNGKFYVVDATAGTSLKAGNVYVVREGILNVGGYSFTQRFTSFEEIQERFDYATLIEVKE